MNHWTSFYNSKHVLNPSPFAKVVAEKYLSASNNRIVDIGCGNGRDSYYFGSLGNTVVGLDKFNKAPSQGSVTFYQQDMSTIGKILRSANANVVYSRFSLHSVTEEIENATLREIAEYLPSSGLLLIEARTVNDPLYGKGTPVGRHAFLGETKHSKAHYRRFLQLDVLTTKLVRLGFAIVEGTESDSFAPYKGENPTCLRIIARKT